MKKEKKSPLYPLYLAFKFLVWVFSPKFKVAGTENLPNEPAVIVGNHSQMYGPIACELFMPGKHYIWCAGEMMSFKEVPAYAFRDFWSQKPARTHFFYKIVSYLIAPLSVLIFNNAHTIGVYHDTRILSTFKTTIKRLSEGGNVIIFPEYDEKYNNIIYNFQDKFIDVAKLYYKKTGKDLPFVPLYIAPKLKRMYLGKPVYFSHDGDISEERERIRNELMKEITQLAVNLPRHKVVPYRNIPKKYYPYNKEPENEKTGS